MACDRGNEQVHSHALMRVINLHGFRTLHMQAKRCWDFIGFLRFKEILIVKTRDFSMKELYNNIMLGLL